MQTDKVYLSKNLVEHFSEIIDLDSFESPRTVQASKSAESCEKCSGSAVAESEQTVEQINRDLVKFLEKETGSEHTKIERYVSVKETGVFVMTDRITPTPLGNSGYVITVDEAAVLKDLGLDSKPDLGPYVFESLNQFCPDSLCSSNIRNSGRYSVNLDSVIEKLKNYISDEDLNHFPPSNMAFPKFYVFKDKVAVMSPNSFCSFDCEYERTELILRNLSSELQKYFILNVRAIVLWLKFRKTGNVPESKKSGINTVKSTLSLVSEKGSQPNVAKSGGKFPAEFFKIADNIRANLPLLSKDTLFSSLSGIYDLLSSEPSAADPDDPYVQVELDQKCSISDPWRFVKENVEVAIDFGTSSTVVAFSDDRGREQLLKLCSFDLSDGDTLNPYENPTVLQFNDIRTFSSAWFGQKYRPLTRWKDVYSSYDGKSQLKDYASSGLSNIKTWAFKRHSSVPVILEDTVSKTIVELLPLPVEPAENDKDLGNWKQRMLDPIEIYGYHLGLCLNTQTLRNGSIYLRYNLTFPVKFDNETKERIRQGLRRGLLRSLPPSLVYSDRWKDAKFHVVLSVSEPVALVASVMPQLGLDDFTKRSYYAFAVFDFGGGTTDFSAGFYREPTEEEWEEYQTEKTIDIIKTSGDAGLGGEKILDLLYYKVLQRNAVALQKEGITFTLPDGFSQFPESERLWGNGSCAHGNASILRENLRPVWEEQEDIVKEKITDPGALSVQFQKDSSSDSFPFNLEVDVEELRNCIENRIRETVNQFIHFFAQAFNQYRSRDDFDELHIIFTGNSSRSSFLRKAFEERMEKSKAEVAGENGTGGSESSKGEIIPHFELTETSFKDSRVTLKTCVALGLLKILRGNIFPNDNSQSGGETPFNYYVGVFRKSFFKPLVNKNAVYNEWQNFSKVRKSITAGNPWILIGWSSDDRAACEDQIPENDCDQKKISFDSEYIGCDVRFRAVAPNVVEFGCFKPETDDSEPLQTVKVYLD